MRVRGMDRETLIELARQMATLIDFDQLEADEV